jgi:hypothetical protein
MPPNQLSIYYVDTEVKRKYGSFYLLISACYWCEGGESNPYELPRQILSLVRLPVPPPSRVLLKNGQFCCRATHSKSLCTCIYTADFSFGAPKTYLFFKSTQFIISLLVIPHACHPRAEQHDNVIPSEQQSDSRSPPMRCPHMEPTPI